MERFWRTALGTGAGLAVLGFAATAEAGGTSGKGGNGCNCTPPPPCNCTVPTGHNVWIPGINVTPPSVTVNSPTITVSAPSINVQTTAYSQSSASASSSANANASATGSAFGSATGQAQSTAFANGLALGGGGSSFSTSEGGSSYVPNFAVEGIEVPQARRICAEFRAAARMVAIQASCIDDKDIPHPASQVQPERDVGIGYEGELYRCIAGSRMQYVLGAFAGTADFSHGQTFTCAKGEALYHAAGGAMACRPQKPARDCNERSLLRRFGAGIKVAQFEGGQECVAYRTEQVQASSSGSGSIVFDGGVGGITR